MRHLTLIAVLLVASRSAAQPIAPPEIAGQGSCEVTIVRAPDDVRREIESWIAREPFCRVALDVRVIPTDGGLYLLARDSIGLLHERLVPDAQAAGVLIASWVADDALEPPPSPPPVPLRMLHLEAGPPPGALLVRALAPEPSSEPLRWGLGVMVFPGDVSGPRVRGTIDVLHHGRLAAELILSGAYSSYEKYMAFRRIDSRALLGLSVTTGTGDWRVRLRAAVGGVWSHAFRTWDTPSANWYAIPLEGSVTVSYHMSPAWSVGVAPIATVYREASFEAYSASLGTDLGVLLEVRRGP
jgi:hypothetical protein